MTVGQRTSLLGDLESGRMSWPQLLEHYGLHLDANDFTFVGRWVTPPFAPRRFDTWFFLVHCPPKQEPHVTGDAELANGEWIGARQAHEKWERNEVLAAPPVLHSLKTLSGGLTDDLVERFLSVPEAHRQITQRMEFRQDHTSVGVILFKKHKGGTHSVCTAPFYQVYSKLSCADGDRPNRPTKGRGLRRTTWQVPECLWCYQLRPSPRPASLMDQVVPRVRSGP